MQFDLIKEYGYPAFITLILIAIIWKQFKLFDKLDRSIKELSKSIKELANYNNYLTASQATGLVKLVFKQHIIEKLAFCDELLTKNDIKNRRQQLESCLLSKFKEITNSEVEFLNQFCSSAGLLGRFIEKEIDWLKFMPEVYQIFFSEMLKEQKLIDLRRLMEKYIYHIIRQLGRNLQGGK